MNSLQNSIRDVFSKNRAEELGYDVWKYFVVPPFFHRLDLKTARKPRVIIGGRGCGKTMLLRYLSHQSMFSPERESVPDDAVSHIGLYWRADTQFCSAMIKRGIEDDVWHAAFKHFAAVVLGIEVIRSLRSIAVSKYSLLSQEDVGRLDFRRLRSFGLKLPESADSLYEGLEELLWEFEGWLNDVRKKKQPDFLPGDKFVHAMIMVVRTQLLPLRDATFYVYLDEYENLCEYQKRIINTWLKHSEVPLIFNLAIKKNAFDIRQTLGEESLSDIHDFRQHDLEAYLLEDGFQAFAAEILILNLSLSNLGEPPIGIEGLRDPGMLHERRKSAYSRKVVAAAGQLLPDVSQKDLAKSVFANESLATKLRQLIQKALKYRNSNIVIDRFIKPELPEASIVASALLFRRKLKVEKVAEEMERLERGEENSFSGTANWIHNNFYGCLLQLYAPYSRACPFYAGFQTFCSLSKGNLRHFLELCHKSIYRAINEDGQIAFPVESILQAEAARQVSKSFLGEIRSFGRLGSQLHTFVLRLGSLFALNHQRLTQSEPEQSHFSISRGQEDFRDEDQQFFKEAVKWSVLFEEEETKKKVDYQRQSLEYVLNPIYAPYFHISYRKRRKLELTTSQVICLIRGNLDQFRTMYREFLTKLAVKPDLVQITLFSPFESEQSDAD